MHSITPVFCDCLDVTYPPGDFPFVLRQILEVGYSAGGSVVAPGQMSFIRVRDKALEVYGAIKFGMKYGVGRISASGASLRALREANVFDQYLTALSDGPYRITRLDATLDQIGDGPSVISSLWEGVRRGEFQLSRKTIPVSDCKKFLGVSLVPGDGRDTGTVYLGTRKYAVRATVYDKRQERLYRGFQDPGPLVRYELGFGRHFPCSLRDASQPERLFWAYAGRSLLPVPSNVGEWTAMSDDDLGFKVERRERDVFGMIDRIMENSADLAKLLELADEIGPQGRLMLTRRLLRVKQPHLALVGGDSAP